MSVASQLRVNSHFDSIRLTHLLLGVWSHASKNSSDDSDETDGNRAAAAEAGYEAMTDSVASAASAAPQWQPRFFPFNLTLGLLILAPISSSSCFPPSLPFHTRSVHVSPLARPLARSQY